MLAFVAVILFLAVVLLAVVKTSQAPNALRASEEAAHSAAVERRAHHESRREPWRSVGRAATASLLGDSRPKTTCRIINTSRSGLRIASARTFPKGAQVHVQWGEYFFVGTVCHTSPQGDESVSGLELLSCNYTHPRSALLIWWR